MEKAPFYKRRWAILMFKTVGIVLLAYLLSLVLMQPFSISTATMLSQADRSDFKISDFYQTVANSRTVRTLSKDIVIVNIDTADRHDIAVILNQLSICNPRAIGLDVMFDAPQENDSDIIDAVANTPNLVLAMSVEETGDGNDVFEPQDTSFFYPYTRHQLHGAVNLPAKFFKSVIRKFRTDFPTEAARVDGHADSIPSFVTAIASLASPEKTEALMARKNARLAKGKRAGDASSELVNFPSIEFRIYEPDDIAEHLDELSGKVVLIGAMSEISDKHVTPINSSMSGVEYHARALSTILNGDYLNEVGEQQNLFIAFLLCAIIAFLSVFVPVSYKGVVLRVVQLAILYFIVRIGYSLFVDHNIVFDLSLTILMVTFGLFAADLWIGVPGLYRAITKAINQRKSKSKNNESHQEN